MRRIEKYALYNAETKETLMPNKSTVKAFREVSKIKKHPERYKTYASVSELMKDLLT